MGLFDIFKRKSNKSEQNLEPASTASQTDQPNKQSEAPVASEEPATSNLSDSGEQELKEKATPVKDAVAQPVVTKATDNKEVNPVGSSTNDDDADATDVPTPPAPAVSREKTDTEPAMPKETEETADTKYEHGLEKTRTGFGARLNALLANFRHVDEDFFDDLEEALIESDVGFEMAVELSDQLREEVKLQNAKSKQDVTNVIIEKMVELYEAQGKGENNNISFASEGPTVILFVGVNGVGKTTTIGKMAAMYQKQGKKVLLAAADTFRAGAIQQLQVWGERDNVPVVTGPEKSDPAAVVFDAVTKARQENYDVLFVDTAGRLQNKVNLMNELEKMKRIISREIPQAPHEVLLVLDATTGQNALSQAKLFQQSTAVTGIVLTKLDGTARGGIVLAIRNELHLPVKYVGLGEKVTDLEQFDASEFVYGLFKGLVKPTD